MRLRPSMVEVRRIDASLLPPIRHAVLWPSVAIEAQLQPFDHADTTIHYGAFVAENQKPTGCITLTHEGYKGDLPPAIAGTMQGQYQVHKFAVMQDYQGQGIGLVLFRHVLEHLQQLAAKPILLHLDARVEQKGWYQRFGLQVLDQEKFTKNGPTGNGPPVEYIRLGIMLH